MIDFYLQPLQHWPQWKPGFINDLHKLRNISRIGCANFQWFIGFGKGSFDEFAVIAIMIDANGNIWKTYSRDVFYFELTQRLNTAARLQGRPNMVYQHIWRIFEKTGTEIDPTVMDMINKMAAEYGIDYNVALTAFTHIYYGMVAEENHNQTKVGKLIKMVGLYQMLYSGQSIVQATDGLCTKKGNPDTGWDVIYAKALSIGLVRKPTNVDDDTIAAVHAAIRDAVIDQRPYTSIFNTANGVTSDNLPPVNIC